MIFNEPLKNTIPIYLTEFLTIKVLAHSAPSLRIFHLTTVMFNVNFEHKVRRFSSQCGLIMAQTSLQFNGW